MRLPFLLTIAATLSLVGCASYPTSSVNQGAADAGIWISGAPVGAQVRVSGAVMGPANTFADAGHAVRLEPGRHEVEILSANGEIISRQVVMLSAGAKYEVRVR